MNPSDVMARAAAPTTAMIQSVTTDHYDRPTPCADWTVRGLLEHLLTWGPPLEAAARKQSIVPSDEVALPEPAWPAALSTQIRRTVDAWSTPAAWDGVTRMGGPTELPAALVGGMVVGEFVVHGWDLGRGLGRDPHWDADLMDYLYDETAKNAEFGRELGVYGPEVPVPESAPMLDRILGLTGRDPAWGR